MLTLEEKITSPSVYQMPTVELDPTAKEQYQSFSSSSSSSAFFLITVTRFIGMMTNEQIIQRSHNACIVFAKRPVIVSETEK